MTTAVTKWGNSLGVRLPKSIAKEARIEAGDAVTLSVKDGAIVIASAGPRYDLGSLVEKINAKNRPDEIDWGPAVGREIW